MRFLAFLCFTILASVFTADAQVPTPMTTNSGSNISGAQWTKTNSYDFILKDENGLSKVRKNAYLTTLIMGYEISKFGLFAGVGYEFEKSENLLVTRFGIEYIGKVNDHIDISPAYIFDTMGGSHVSHTFALAIGYHF